MGRHGADLDPTRALRPARGGALAQGRLDQKTRPFHVHRPAAGRVRLPLARRRRAVNDATGALGRRLQGNGVRQVSLEDLNRRAPQATAITRLLNESLHGDSESENQLYSIIYDHLHGLAEHYMGPTPPMKWGRISTSSIFSTVMS